MSKPIRLRNPDCVYKDLDPATDNIYEMRNRDIRPQNGVANVKVYLDFYPNVESADAKKNGLDQTDYTLTGIEDNQGQLNPVHYVKILMEQHGDTVLQGTSLKDFLLENEEGNFEAMTYKT